VILNSVEEELVNRIWGLIGVSSRFIGFSDLLANTGKFVSSVKVWYDTRVKSILDILKERLLDHIVI
jgi:hypothetical protein